MLHAKIDTDIQNPQIANQTMVDDFTSKLQIKTYALNHTGAMLVDLEELFDRLKSDTDNYLLKNFRLFDYQNELVSTLYKQTNDLKMTIADIKAEITNHPNLVIEADKCEMAALEFAIHCAEDDAKTWFEKVQEDDVAAFAHKH